MRKSWIALALVLCCTASAFAVEIALKDAGDLRLQIYGFVKADYAYDSQVTAPKNTFALWVLPEANGDKDAQTQFGARETRLGLNLFGPDFGNWKATGKLEMDFYGGGPGPNSYNPRIRLAYVDVANKDGLAFRIGQDWDTFCELVPRIVNFGYLADIGALGQRRPQARATQEIKFSDDTKLVAKIAAGQTMGEGPNQDLDGGGYDDGADADYPTAQWNVALHQKLWTEKAARIAFAGHYGIETMDGVDSNKVVIANDVKDYDSWSIQGFIFLPLTKTLAAQANLWQGANLDQYFGGIGQGVNMALAKEIAAIGGFAQLLWDPSEKWSYGLGYSVDDPKDEDLNAGMRSKNEQIFVNAFYKFTAALTGMAEYTHMVTDYAQKADATDDRVQVAMKYSF
jgi:hypothetical protein